MALLRQYSKRSFAECFHQWNTIIFPKEIDIVSIYDIVYLSNYDAL